jgi:hypothetical protein
VMTWKGQSNVTDIVPLQWNRPTRTKIEWTVISSHPSGRRFLCNALHKNHMETIDRRHADSLNVKMILTIVSARTDFINLVLCHLPDFKVGNTD